MIANLPFDRFGVLFLGDVITDPDPTPGDIAIYRLGNIVWLRDVNGVKWPLVPGASGAGIRNVTGSYPVAPGDTDIRVDTTAVGIVITLELAAALADGRPIRVHNIGPNALTVDGNGSNVNGSATATVAAGQSLSIEWVATFGAVAAQWVS